MNITEKTNEIELKQTEKLNNVELCMLKQPQVPCPVTHRFGPGIYMRELFLPAGTLVIGHKHNFEHINILLKGSMTLFAEDGTRKKISAPMTFVGKPGRKTAYTHEDCIFMNVFATTETNIEKLEAHFLTKSEAWLSDNKERSKLKLITSSIDRDDYFKAISEFGITEKEARRISEDEDDLIALPFGDYKIKTGPSRIEGIGLFATADINSSELIAPARIGGKRTVAGRFTNHAHSPNAQMIKMANGDIGLQSIQKISGCLGGQDGEEITINYRDALRLNKELLCQR